MESNRKNVTPLPPKKVKNIRKLIIGLSIILPIAVAALFVVKVPGYEKTFSFLPAFYASINGVTACLLVLALVLVKKKQYKAHERAIKVCMALSVVFLLCYVLYHITSPTTYYGDSDHSGKLLDGAELKAVKTSFTFYMLLLVSHILLSIAVVPLVLFAYLHAWEGNFVKHKRWTRIAWPIWFYVAISGVVVYCMISPYYKF
jgi:putative membrane protein